MVHLLLLLYRQRMRLNALLASDHTQPLLSNGMLQLGICKIAVPLDVCSDCCARMQHARHSRTGISCYMISFSDEFVSRVLSVGARLLPMSKPRLPMGKSVNSSSRKKGSCYSMS